MRISMVIGTLERGGAEHQMARLALELVARGHDVEVITLHGWGPLQPRLEAGGVPVLGLAPPDRRWRIRKVHGAIDLTAMGVRMRSHWRAWRPDVVQAWLPEAQVVALPLARQLRVPVRVMSLRSLRSGVRPGLFMDRCLAVAAASSTLITANSHAVAADPGWPTGAGARVVIPNGVVLPNQLADVTREPAVGVVVANLLPYKGHADLFSALALSISRPRMVLVGEGPERARLECEASRLGISDLIEFRGSVGNPMELLLQSQFAVLPSHTEGLPNAVLEAMAAGLPTVATDVGGVPDLITPGVNGLMVPSRDPHSLSRAIDRLAGDPWFRSKLGQNARHNAESYSWQFVTTKFIEAITGG